MQGDLRTYQLKQQIGRHRQAQRPQRLVGDRDRSALINSGEDLRQHPQQQPIYHETSRVLDQHGVLLQLLGDPNAVASVSSSVAGPRTISTSGSTATGLKKWKPTTRSG